MLSYIFYGSFNFPCNNSIFSGKNSKICIILRRPSPSQVYKDNILFLFPYSFYLFRSRCLVIFPTVHTGLSALTWNANQTITWCGKAIPLMALINGFPVPGPSPPVKSWTLFLHLSSGPALLLWPEEYNPSDGVPVSRGHVCFCSFSASAAWMCLLEAEGPRREEPRSSAQATGNQLTASQDPTKQERAAGSEELPSWLVDSWTVTNDYYFRPLRFY